MDISSQIYRQQFPVFCEYRFSPENGGDLYDFRVLMVPTQPYQRPIDVTHLVPPAALDAMYERELDLQLEVHAESQRLLATVP